MAITDTLSAAQGGQFFANAARATGLSEAETGKLISAYAPRIATRLKEKVAADPEAFDSLLDLLEDGGDTSDLDDVDAMTGTEALGDGAAVLSDLYGSKSGAAKSLGASSDGETKAAAISAVSVLAVLAASNAQSFAGGAVKAAETGSSGGGLISIIIAALLKGLLQGVQRQLAPKRRRRRYTYSTRRRRTTKRRTKRPGLDDIFKDILTGRR